MADGRPVPPAFYECEHADCAEEYSFPADELSWVDGKGWCCPSCAPPAGTSLAAHLAARADAVRGLLDVAHVLAARGGSDVVTYDRESLAEALDRAAEAGVGSA